MCVSCVTDLTNEHPVATGTVLLLPEEMELCRCRTWLCQKQGGGGGTPTHQEAGMHQSENPQQHSFLHLLPHNVRAVSEAAKALRAPWSQQSCLLQKAGVAPGKGRSSGCKNLL